MLEQRRQSNHPGKLRGIEIAVGLLQAAQTLAQKLDHAHAVPRRVLSVQPVVLRRGQHDQVPIRVALRREPRASAMTA